MKYTRMDSSGEFNLPDVTITPVEDTSSSSEADGNESPEEEMSISDITTMTPVPADSDSEDEEDFPNGLGSLLKLTRCVPGPSTSTSVLQRFPEFDSDSDSDLAFDSDEDDELEMARRRSSEEGETDDDDLVSMLTTAQEVGFREVTSNFIAGGLSITDFAASVLQGIGVTNDQASDMMEQLPLLSAEVEQSREDANNSAYPIPVECFLDESPGTSTALALRRPLTPELDSEAGPSTPPTSPLPPFNLLDCISPRGDSTKPSSPTLSHERIKNILGSPMAGPVTDRPESVSPEPEPMALAHFAPSRSAETTKLLDDLHRMPDNVLVDADGGGYTDIAQKRREFPRPGFYGTGDTPSELILSRRKKLPPTFQNLIGEAHVQFARGNHKTAIEICMEIIKEEPMCPEPYNTLAMIYENAGQNRESLQFALIAALLNPKGCHEWPRLAEMCIEYKMSLLALTCLTKAIIVDPLDADLHLKRCALLENKGDIRGALRGYSKILSVFSKRGELCVQVLRRSAKLYHSSGSEEKAYDCLRNAMDHFPKYITVTESNLMLELCVAMKKYVEAARVLITYSRVKFIPTLEEECFESREKLTAALKLGNYECVPPTPFNVDLEAKLIIVLVHLEAFPITHKLSLEMIRVRDVELYGDLFLEIAESYMAKRRYEFPLNFLQPLIDSETFSQAAIWLRYAECLFLLNRYEEAAVAYKRVVTLAPAHNLAKLNLSIILQKLGRTQDALETLSQDKEEDAIDHELLMEKCHILYKRKEYLEFMDCVLQLLCRFSCVVQSRDDAMVIVMVTNYSKRLTAVEVERAGRGCPEEDPKPRFIEKDVKVEREWKLYLKLCRLLCSMERWDLLARVTYTACASKLFSKYKGMEKEAEAHCFFASLMCADEELLPNHIRVFMSRYATNQLVLNLFGVVLKLCDHSRYTKHILRLLEKNPKDYRLMLLNAHLSFATGTYKNALMEYTTLYALTPDDPIIPLMISCTLLHVMTQKTTQGRVELSINIIAFMKKYVELRGDCQESYYNMGRTLHFMGMTALALQYYERVLKTPPVPPDTHGLLSEFVDDEGVLDLTCEAAYNMAQIYQATGAPELARECLMKYIQI